MGWLEKRKWQETSIKLGDGATITVKQILDATKNFTRNEIGRGSSAIVFKVAVHSHIVAVKKLYKSTIVPTKLREEVYTLKCLEHEKIVKFFGSFSKKDLHLLVFEFMEYGSLYSALFDRDSKIKLNWDIRYDICLEIAKGLRYLHEEKVIHFIHGDLKPSKILLDGNLKAKISDFGSAKIYDENNWTEIIEGTYAIMAPEYAMRGFFSDKTDVYSFGILLLEIVSGSPNARDLPGGRTIFIIDEAYEFHKAGRLIDLVDKSLKHEFSMEQAVTVLNLAIACTNISLSFRPKISEVVDVLEGKISYVKPVSPAEICLHCNGIGILSRNVLCLDCHGTGVQSNTFL